MRRPLRPALALALAAGLAVVRGAGGAGPAITYVVTAGTAGDNGWYVSDVTAQIGVSGATDSSCPVVKTFRSSSDSLDCTATDGTSTVSFHLQFKIDKDPPAVTGATADRPPNGNGWYSSPVTVSFSGSDATSGIASCQQVAYSGPDSGSASVSGTCRDVAGNVSAPLSFALQYDGTPPSVTASPARAPDANGWYDHPVAVSFGGSDATSGVDSCTSASYGGPDTAGTTLTGTCTDRAGNSASATFSLQYDATPPSVKIAPARPPDANGWYNHRVAAKVTGTDTGSGIDSCSGSTYDGPPSDHAVLTGTCRDRAGNAASASAAVKYDATPPRVAAVSATGGNGTVTLRWQSTGAAAVTLVRTTLGRGRKSKTVYHGKARSFTDTRLTNGLRYRYTLDVVDEAGNTARRIATATPRALLAPLQGARLKRPPRLVWVRVRGAAYYNVQLFFEGRKVLSVWPLGTSLALPRSWTFDGRRHALARGRYRWYVWPGFGPRKASKYGRLLGGSAFVVTRS